MAHLLIIAMGLALLGAAFYVRSRYSNAKDWPSTQGTLTHININHFQEPMLYYSVPRYFPEVEYSYSVGGVPYTGSTASFEKMNFAVYEEKLSKQAWANWKPGESVTVYYSPENPENSVLFPSPLPERSSHIKALSISGILVILAGIGIGVLNA